MPVTCSAGKNGWRVAQAASPSPSTITLLAAVFRRPMARHRLQAPCSLAAGADAVDRPRTRGCVLRVARFAAPGARARAWQPGGGVSRMLAASRGPGPPDAPRPSPRARTERASWARGMRFGVSQPSPDRVSVTLAGDLTLDEARAAYDTLLELADRPDIREVWVDFAAVEAFDSPAAGSVSEACERLRDVGKRVELVNVGPRQRSTFELVLVRVPPPAAAPRPPSLATRLRTSSRRLVRGAYDFADLVLDTVGISARVLVR